MKEQEKAMSRYISKTDISNMPTGEVKSTILRIVSWLEKRIEGINETLTTEIKELEKNQRLRTQ